MNHPFRSPTLAVLALCLAYSIAQSAWSGPDWLIDASPYRATVKVEGGGAVLDNGLVRRTFVTDAGRGATVSLDNLMTGEQMLRSIRPEAVVEIDGVRYPVGGLTGQPVQNYLDPAWLAKMTPEPGAFVLEKVETGKTVERFAWKKRPEWMPQDLPWPPPGVSLTLRFRAPDEWGVGELPRRVLAEDDFAKLGGDWKPSYSTAHDRTSFANEGKPGELMARANTFAFVERALPAGTKVVQCTIDPGIDQSATWGPGIVVVFRRQTVKFNLRTAHKAFGIGDAATGKLQDGKPCTMRIRLVPGAAVCEASWDGGKAWEKVGVVHVSGEPTAVRLGKTDRAGGAGDHNDAGEAQPERCRFTAFRVFGDPEPKAIERARAAAGEGAGVDVHYELYDGIPLMSKWITVRNPGKAPVRLNRFTAEQLALVEAESTVEPNVRWEHPKLYVETDYAFLAFNGKGASQYTVHWKTDPSYKTQVSFDLQTPCLLECAPPIGPDQEIVPGGTFESFRVFELLLDSTERERTTLAQRRMYRTLAPWVTENPILMHDRSADPAAVRLAIDQCADVGFEMVIMTFGSGFNYESRDPAYQAKFKELADYAKSKGIALGGYSLLASRGAGTGADNTRGVPARYGVMPCLGAKWGIDYLAQLRSFMSNAGLGVLEHDGSYPGDRCAAHDHTGHRGLDDSQWAQWRAITDLYKWGRANGVYLNIPDWYFLTGGSKIGMGYRETNWSLPREYQEIIERQNIFDGTWDKTPSMGWMFVPLTEYQGGGAAATIEPLKDHLPHYEQRMANLFGAGVQACYRGPRLYDAPETRDAVKKWVGFYKKHRAILDSDIIHLRRADGRDLDYILHVNPALKEKGLLFVYNPLPTPVSRTLTVPLYYTGLTDAAQVREQGGPAKAYKLDRKFNVEIPLTVPARGHTWLVVE